MSINVTDKMSNPPQVKRLRDYVAILLDSSGSMSPWADRAYSVLREQFENIGKLQEDPNRDTYLDYYTFDYRVTPHVINTVGKRNVPPRDHYLPNGGTALLDAIGQATESLSKYDLVTADKDTSFLVVAITDGEENSSRYQSFGSLKSLIQAKQSKDNWTFVVLCPFGKKRAIVQNLGIPEGNVDEWDGGRASEYQRVSTQLSASTQSYYTTRAAGERSTKSFFTTCAKDYTRAEAAVQLHDVTSQYKKCSVTKETDITTFCTYHNGSYSPGQAFFMLTKPEEVQDGKLILLRDKASGAIYGDGSAAVRVILGLPHYGGVMVRPGNHGDWDIFVQSKSVNRKLVRGTQVLIKK